MLNSHDRGLCKYSVVSNGGLYIGMTHALVSRGRGGVSGDGKVVTVFILRNLPSHWTEINSTLNFSYMRYCFQWHIFIK